MAGIFRWGNGIFKSILPILWVYMTGALWTTRNTLASWALGMSVDSGIKSSPSNVKPITITLQTVGSQQDNSSQQMTRTITGYRKSDGVAVQLYTITNALGPTINTTDSVVIDGTVEYNRIVGYNSGKLKAGTYLEIKITSWNQKS